MSVFLLSGRATRDTEPFRAMGVDIINPWAGDTG